MLRRNLDLGCFQLFDQFDIPSSLATLLLVSNEIVAFRSVDLCLVRYSIDAKELFLGNLLFQNEEVTSLCGLVGFLRTAGIVPVVPTRHFFNLALRWS